MAATTARENVLNVAILSRWHVHADEYASSVAQHPQARIAAVWDESPNRGREWAKQLDVEFAADLDALLQRHDVDAVCVVTPTNMHRDVMVSAAQAGKHIFTEKVLAASCDAAVEIGRAIVQNNVTFCISFPRRNQPELQYAKKVLDEGLLGDLTAIRIRIAHAGASRNWLPDHFYDLNACEGGAMMDLGAHGMYLSGWFGGIPKRVTSIFAYKTSRDVEDNAVSVIEFENGVIAVNETSFVAYPDSYSVELDGTEGAFKMLSPREGAHIRSDHLAERGWQQVTELPVRGMAPIDQWIEACLGGIPNDLNLRDAVELTELMDAAYASHQLGKTQGVKSVFDQI